MHLALASADETERLGGWLAFACDHGGVIHLHGELGAGKTTLVRGFLRARGHRGAVKSPTYTLMEPYQLGGRACFHLDLYRLADPEELEYLGLRDLLEPGSVLLVEWPERGGDLLPSADLVLHLVYADRGTGQGRQVEVEACSAVGNQMLRVLDKQNAADQVKS